MSDLSLGMVAGPGQSPMVDQECSCGIYCSDALLSDNLATPHSHRFLFRRLDTPLVTLRRVWPPWQLVTHRD